MRISIFILLFLVACKKAVHCENATVYKSAKCGVDWEVQFEGQRYPVDSLPETLKKDKNEIFIMQYHFYDDLRMCACCGYKHLVIENARDEVICL